MENKDGGNLIAPPCLGEALRRGIIIASDHGTDLHASGAKSRSCSFQQSKYFD
jgi:hypothetical protein